MKLLDVLMLGLLQVLAFTGLQGVGADESDEAWKKDDKAFAELLKSLKEADDQWDVGFAYRSGLGVAQDYTEAMKWYRKAADQGHLPGYLSIGEMYEKGQGVTRDYDEALKWYQKIIDPGQKEILYKES